MHVGLQKKGDVQVPCLCRTAFRCAGAPPEAVRGGVECVGVSRSRV